MLKKLYKPLISKASERESHEVRESELQFLRDYFSDDVARLETLLDRENIPWKLTA